MDEAMDDGLVKTGIDVIGEVPWGTHFCQFYQTKADLLDTLVPYFKAGLENNEFCMWITSEPLSAQEARRAIRRAVPDFADRLARGQIEILPHTKWYLEGGKFDQQRVLDGWVNKLNAALAAGYAGLRLTGNTFWLEKPDWRSFTDYEAAVNDVIGKHHMLALCTYSLDKCGAAEIMDVIRNHEFALIRREGKWEIIENAIHKQTKQALLESQGRYRLLVESLQEGVGVVDRDLRATFVNPRMAEMLGYTIDEIVGKSLFDFMKESDQQSARQLMEKRLQGSSGPVEFTFRRKGGGPLHALVSSSPLTDDQGHFSGFVAGVVDITNRKLLEEELRRSQSLMEAVTEGTGVIMATQDTDFRYTYFNKPYKEEIKRLTGKELHVGDSMIALFAEMPEQQRVAIEEWGRMLRGETVIQRIEFGDPGRHRSTYSTFHTPIRDQKGDVVGAGEVAFDISQQARLEEALRQNEAGLKKAQEIAHVGSWELDVLSNRLTWSDEVYRIFGLQPQEFDATYEAFLDAVHPDDRAAVDATYSASLREGKDAYEIEHRVVRRSNGEVRFVDEKCEHIRDESGRVVKSIGMVHDMTDKVLAEKDRRESEERLRTIIENAWEGIVILDEDYSLSFESASLSRIGGYERGEWQGTSLGQMNIHPDDLAMLLNRLENLKSQPGSKIKDVTVRYGHKDGSWRWIEATGQNLLHDPKVKGIVVNFRDVTEHHLTEEALRESEEKYRLLFQNMAEGFALYELLYDEEGQPVDWRVLEMNDAYTHHTGIARETILGRRIGEVYPEVLPEYLPRFAQVVATQTPVQFETYSKPAGRYMRVNTFPAGGHRFASTFEDISERIGAERRIHLLAETASELLKTEWPEIVVNSLCTKVMLYLDCDVFFNYLVDESAGRLRLNAFAGISSEQAQEIEWLDYGVAVCGCAARDRCRVVAENILETPDPRTELVKSYGIQAYACHPLMAQDRLLGTLSFGTRTRPQLHG